MTAPHCGKPTLPPAAESEILEQLYSNMQISADEVAAILKKHNVSGDVDILQDRYRKQLGQRLIAGIRDDEGKREVLSNGNGRYVVLECCSDEQQLKSIRRRIQGQMKGLDASVCKVQARIRVLDRLKAHFEPEKKRKAAWP